MLIVYINYPDPKFSVHGDPGCGIIRMHQKAGQRSVRLTIDSMSAELRRFRDKEHRFSATSELNDMWLEIEMQYSEFEWAVVKYIQRLIGRHYGPLSNARIEHHC